MFRNWTETSSRQPGLSIRASILAPPKPEACRCRCRPLLEIHDISWMGWTGSEGMASQRPDPAGGPPPRHRRSGESGILRRSGRDIRGIFRVHQFEKIEQFVLSDPEKRCAQRTFASSAPVSAGKRRPGAWSFRSKIPMKRVTHVHSFQ